MRFGIRELVFVTLMLGLLGSSYFFVFKKADERRRIKLAEMEQWDKQLVKLNRVTAGTDDVNGKIAELQRAIDFFSSKLPAAREIDRVLTEVSERADANALTSKTVKPLKVERGHAFSEQSIEMNLAGSFEGFYSFLLEMEKLPRITRITNMKLEKINERDGEMTAQLTLSIYFEPDAGNNANSPSNVASVR